MDENLCGYTQYFGDQYINGECQFRKCADTCIDGSYKFSFEGKEYERTVYCCNTDYCNNSFKKFTNSIIYTTTILIVFLTYIFIN